MADDPDFKPDYKTKCENCEQTPTVEMIDGNKAVNTGMCGPCFFGEAACIDPEEW